MPFECEGNRRAQQAQAALEQLRAAGDGVVCLPNEKIMKLVGEEVGLRAVFTISDGLLADGVSGVARLLSCPSLIEINADDLRDLLRANRMESFFAAAEASGENRARDTVEQLLKNPLLDDGEALASAGSVLVSIVGGPGLTMAEIKRVMEQINRHCDGAQVVMGAGEDAALGDRLCVTVIATRRERITVAASASLGVMLPTTETEEEAAPVARFLPTPSLLAPTKLEMSGGKRPSLRGRKGGSKMKQEQLSLEMNAKGRFDKSEPTIRNGEDLDEPTYLRRGLVLN
jgi:cell division protein FtsZ